MKNNIVLSIIASFGIFLISTSCKNSSANQSASGNEKPAAFREQSKEIPKNWPWRGVSIESKKSKPSDIAYLASINVNCIRIFIKPDKRAKRENIRPALAFRAEVAWADSLINEAKKHNMTSIIAYNNLVSDPNDEVNDKSSDFWEKRVYQDSAISRFEMIVNMMKGHGDELVAYEVIGEPAVEKLGRTKTPDGIEDFYKRVLATIRKYDSQRYLLLTPGPWGKPTNYTDFNGYNINDAKIVYSSHMYLPEQYTHQGVKKRSMGGTYPGKIEGNDWNKALVEKRFAPIKQFQKKTNALIYIGEFQSVRWAPGGDEWVKDVLDVIEENGWAWSQYGYQCDTDFWDPYYEPTGNTDSKTGKPELVFKGKETNQWKMMVKYYSRNAK